MNINKLNENNEIEGIPYVIYEEGLISTDLQFFEGLGLQCLSQPPDTGPWFSRESGVFGLRARTDGRVVSSYVDFTDPALLHRLKTSGKRQGIGQAVGLNRTPELNITDGTAGLGRDSFILAGLGCRVNMLERNPLAHYLLQDGLRRGLDSENAEVRQVCSRLTLHLADTIQWCKVASTSTRPDVLYLDPMFPHRTKSAKVKKDIAGLQMLAGPDEDIRDLLEASLLVAKSRVVVKRPRSKDRSYFEDVAEPVLQLTGKSVQYDVFLAQN